MISIIAYADHKQGQNEIAFDEKAVAPLFFTDGVFNVLFSYPENVLHWLSYLQIHENWNPLKSIFENQAYSVFETMKLMDEFFKKRDSITVGKERGDRLKISSKDGSPYNIENSENLYKINEQATKRIIDFMLLIGEMTKWNYCESDWICWDNLKYYKFSKSDFKARGWNLTNERFEHFLSLKPLSWAMTSGTNIEFTLEEPSKLV